MKINVRAMDGKTTTVEVSLFDTLSSVEKKLSEKGFNFEGRKIAGGKTLVDTKTLFEQGIRDGTKLYSVPRIIN